MSGSGLSTFLLSSMNSPSPMVLLGEHYSIWVSKSTIPKILFPNGKILLGSGSTYKIKINLSLTPWYDLSWYGILSSGEWLMKHSLWLPMWVFLGYNGLQMGNP